MITNGSRQIIFGILMLIPLRYLGAELPESFEHAVSFGGTDYTAALEFYSNRGPNFEVWQQKDDGTFETLTVPIVGTYIGTLKGVPGSTVSALRFDSGIVYYKATFEDGSEWWSNGYATRMSCNAARNAKSRQDCSAPALKYPTFVAPAGGAGS